MVIWNIWYIRQEVISSQKWHWLRIYCQFAYYLFAVQNARTVLIMVNMGWNVNANRKSVTLELLMQHVAQTWKAHKQHCYLSLQSIHGNQTCLAQCFSYYIIRLPCKSSMNKLHVPILLEPSVIHNSSTSPIQMDEHENSILKINHMVWRNLLL